MKTSTTRQLHEVRTVVDVRDAVRDARRRSGSVAFVPTMGALHAGHEQLLRCARARFDVVVASCYVNPAQFGAGEDLSRYPRTPDHDRAVAARAGVDVLWLPGDREIYGDPRSQPVGIDVGPLGDTLEGEARPGHFDGVATVVVRLLGAVMPDAMLLGRKDYQQLVVLRRVVADLLMGVEVVDVATVRDEDGLALSSRNAYLSDDERVRARTLSAALRAARAAFAAGARDPLQLLRIARTELDPDADVDYVELVRDDTLDRVVGPAAADDVLLVAARIGGTRLLDNARLGGRDL